MRGAPLILSAAEVDLIAAWEKAGLPLDVVLEGIERTFERPAARAPAARPRPDPGLLPGRGRAGLADAGATAGWGRPAGPSRADRQDRARRRRNRPLPGRAPGRAPGDPARRGPPGPGYPGPFSRRTRRPWSGSTPRPTRPFSSCASEADRRAAGPGRTRLLRQSAGAIRPALFRPFQLLMTTNDSHRILEALRRNRQGLTLADLFRELRVAAQGAGPDRRPPARAGRAAGSSAGSRPAISCPSSPTWPAAASRRPAAATASSPPKAATADDVYVPARLAKGAVNGDEVEVVFSEKGRTGRPEGRIVRILRKEKKQPARPLSSSATAGRISPPSTRPGPRKSRSNRSHGLFPKPGMIVAVDRTGLALTDVLGFPDDAGRRHPGRRPPLRPGRDLHARRRSRGRGGRRPARRRGQGPGRFPRAGRRSPSTARPPRTSTTPSASASWTAAGGCSASTSPTCRTTSGRERRSTGEAYDRATSVYFPGLTLPMLPERLSNDVCSLRPRVDRRAFSVLMEIDADGAGRPLGVHSLAHPDGRAADLHRGLRRLRGRRRASGAGCARSSPTFSRCASWPRLLRRRRLEAGSLDFDLIEPELVYSEGRLTGVAGFAPNEAHKLIEEFMVAANVAVAASPGAAGASPRSTASTPSRTRPTWKSCARSWPISGSSCPSRPRSDRTTCRPPSGRPRASRPRPSSTSRSCGPCGWPSTPTRTSAITAWPRRTTPISRRPSGAIPTSSSIASSRRLCGDGGWNPSWSVGKASACDIQVLTKSRVDAMKGAVETQLSLNIDH